MNLDEVITGECLIGALQEAERIIHSILKNNLGSVA